MGVKISNLPTATEAEAASGLIPVVTDPNGDGNLVTKHITASMIGGSGGASVNTSAAPPGSPSNGDLWFDEENAELYIYNTSINGWIQTNGGGGGGSGGGVGIETWLMPNKPSAKYNAYNTVTDALTPGGYIDLNNAWDIDTSKTYYIFGAEGISYYPSINDSKNNVYSPRFERPIRIPVITDTTARIYDHTTADAESGLITNRAALIAGDAGSTNNTDYYIWMFIYEGKMYSAFSGEFYDNHEIACHFLTSDGGSGSTTGTGQPRAYVAFDGLNPNGDADLTDRITNSLNVSSIVYNSVGSYTINFTTPVPNPVVSYSYQTKMTNISNIHNDHRCVTAVSSTSVTVEDRSDIKEDTEYTSIVVH